MVKLLISILGNTVALYAATYMVPGFVITGWTREYLIAGTILGILNITVKPILKIVAFPLMIITLGLFSLIINAGMLWVLDYALSFVSISGLAALGWATIVVAVVNLVIFRKV